VGNSFLIKLETKATPLILVLIRSAISLRKRDSVLDGIIVVVMGDGPDDKEATIEPILFEPSVIETKYPLSNFKIDKEKFRLSKFTIFWKNPFGEFNKL
jgi:hypothetical protein